MSTRLYSKGQTYPTPPPAAAAVVVVVPSHAHSAQI